ncbi:hypothetical protein CCMSSC00406_0006442 [Pleurotus cornucopiae]|uniref:Uncharacterized protein n=1 Tax=Pleurotus cornucopiae TaxID=5321 RepID=A0ACB7J9I7_PLECO|nr:hypothetical protein CCMSSC00406_0006442 [Pleurotus cornucopiae]
MVKFSKGMWCLAPDTVADWATEAVKAEAKEDSIRCVASTRRINHRGDTLNNPTITLECSSPAPDVLLLKGYHWKEQVGSNAGPEYELFPDIDLNELNTMRQDNVQTSKTNNLLKLSTSTVSATINTDPSSFGIDFHGSNRLLTKLGWRSTGYVKINSTLGHANAAMVDPDRGERWFTYQFQLSVGEKIYGLGERFGPFIKNGQTVEMWNEDGGTSSELTYKNIPFYLSSRGYGIFIPHSGFVSFEVQSERTTRVNISVRSESLSAYIIHGPSPSDIISRYTLLTGRPALPPPWTFSLFLTTSFTTDYDEKTVNHFLEGMEERDIPVGVFHFDCFWMKGFQWCDFEFDEEFFPDAGMQLKRMRDKGYKICVWINPYIAQESKLFDEGARNGYFIKKTDGSVWQWDWWQAGMGFVDFTNPAACGWYQSKLKALIDLGVDCFKTDFGERIPTGDVVYHDTSVNAEKMHNYYAHLYNKSVFGVLEKQLGKNQAIVFARSATAGGQRFPVHWGGDPMSTFEAMAETLRGGLSLGVCGFGYWAHDIGGFEGKPDPALYKRWFAFGALSSHSRLHGSGSYRVPWLIDASGEADKVLSKFINLKLSLMPYIYATALATHRTGIPMMRPMFVEFPDDPVSWYLDTQYMLGKNLLVAPVFTEDGSVQYYVPEGKWYGLVDGKIRVGPGYVEETHDFMSIPLLLRPGTAIVFGQHDIEGKRKLSTYDYSKDISVLVNGLVKDGEVMDFEIVIPDADDPGDVKGTLKVEGTNREVKVTGTIPGPWKVKVIQEDGSLKELH